MKTDKITLVSYTKGEEAVNCITHLAGLILPTLIAIEIFHLCKDSFTLLCAVLYAIGTALTFLCSFIYHVLPHGNMKKIFRVIDHSAIFFAVAGTITGCVPQVFLKGSAVGAVLMLIVAWIGVIAGLCLTVFNFEKYKNVRMGLYIFSSAFSALLGGSTFFNLPIEAFICLMSGGATLLIGCVFYKMGVKRRYIHSIFHVFIVLGLGIFYYGIKNYVYLML